MARRNRNTTDEAQEAPVTTTTEAPEAAPEAVEASTENTEAPEATPEVAIDLTAFNAAVAEAVAEKDSATGEVAPAFIDPVNKAYRALDGLKAKNKAKAALNEAMKESMNNMDIQTARAYLTLTENLSAAGGGTPKAEKSPADPTAAFIDKYVTLRLALELATPPEGVAEDWKDKAATVFKANLESANGYVAWVANEAEDKGDAPEVSTIVKAAVKLSQGKAARVGSSKAGSTPYTGERRDIAKHIASAFADLNEGDFLSVAEIKKHHSDEYGDNSPSAGAISARLFPSSGKCTLEGVEPGTNDKGNKGAKKVA